MHHTALLTALLVAAAPAAARQPPAVRCLRYAPDTVEMTGRLERHTFYGAPGYGEDPAHDEKETR